MHSPKMTCVCQSNEVWQEGIFFISGNISSLQGVDPSCTMYEIHTWNIGLRVHGCLFSAEASDEISLNSLHTQPNRTFEKHLIGGSNEKTFSIIHLHMNAGKSKVVCLISRCDFSGNKLKVRSTPGHHHAYLQCQIGLENSLLDIFQVGKGVWERRGSKEKTFLQNCNL